MTFLQPISKNQYKDKYMINGEKKEEEVIEGVAQEVSSVEKKEIRDKVKGEFFEAISSGKFMPGGRILANARPGGKMKNYGNCFTLPIEDSMDGIYETLKKAALLSKAGGGVGINYSTLRPKDASLSKGGASSGAVSFMRMFNASGDVIRTGGNRRSAQIALLDVSHPDIEEFISCKSGGKTLSNMNISVIITDKFMKAVENGSDWDLVWGGKVYKTVKAKYLYNLITENAYYHNEPGVFFIDEVEKNNNAWWKLKLDAVNPCFSEDTLITTKSGLYPIKDLVGKEVEIFDGNEWITCNNFRVTGENKDLYRVTLHSGVYYDVTDSHRFILETGETRTTLEIKEGDKLEYNIENQVSHGSISEPGAYLKGFMLSEGSMVCDSRPSLYVYSPKYSCIPRLVESILELPIVEVNTNVIEEVGYTGDLDTDAKVRITGMSCRGKEELKLWGSDFKKKIPVRIFSWDLPSKLDFIAGVLDGDGSALDGVNGFAYQIQSINKEFLVDFLRLLSTIGVYGKIDLSHPKKVKIIKGKEYICQDCYRITISQKYSILLSKQVRFSRLISLSHKQCMYRLGFKYNKVVSIERVSKGNTVYCCTIPSTHKLLINSGIVIGQCGELPLPSKYGQCNLGSINLTKFISNPFDKQKVSFDFEDFRRTIHTAVRFLDNVIDCSEAPLPQTQEVMDAWRRIGLGFTGLGDTFAMMCIRYGDADSIALSKKIGQVLRDESYKASSNLAVERGSFPEYDKVNILQSKFIKRLPEDIQSLIKKNGLRNIALNTCAPTGTTSLALGNNCSSGIEPIFSLEHKRRVRINGTDKYEEEIVKDYAWLLYLSSVSKDVANPKAPDYFVTIQDLDPYKGAEVQAAFQEYIDGAISKTANLPKGFSYEKYKNLFKFAYEKGLKGFTSFNPEGSMEGILDSGTNCEPKEKRPDLIERHFAPSRPQGLKCDIHDIIVNTKRYIVLVGLLGSDPYEIFVTEDAKEKIDLQKNKTGIIYKESKSKYNLLDPEGKEVIIENIGATFDSIDLGLSRMVSMSLRHGVPIQFICAQLDKSSNMSGFKKGVMRVLKHYIKNNEKVLHHVKCPECGSNSMIYIEGCKKCLACSYTACT